MTSIVKIFLYLFIDYDVATDFYSKLRTKHAWTLREAE